MSLFGQPDLGLCTPSTQYTVYLSNEILPHISCEGAKTCAGFAIWGPLVIISLSV